MKAIKAPILLFFVVTSCYFFLPILSNNILFDFKVSAEIIHILQTINILIIFCGLFWLFVNVINLITTQLSQYFSGNRLLISILPLIDNSLKIIAFISLLDVIMAYLNTPDKYQIVVEKVIQVIVISAISIIVVRIITSYEKLITQYYARDLTTNIKSRQLYTQVNILKRVILTLVGIFSLAAILMVFENVREIGISIFGAAGIASAIIGFAGQKSLGNFIACLQIAFSQPIKIGDMVTVESEFGSVEEITMTYVVLKIWDLRRLIIPLSYFIEKPFQNFTRSSANLLCPVFLYVDYLVPLDKLRKEFERILHQSRYWDKSIKAFHVSDAKTNVMEIRLLASAEDSNAAWELRCEIRENMIQYISKNYPSALPQMRGEIKLQVKNFINNKESDMHYGS